MPAITMERLRADAGMEPLNYEHAQIAKMLIPVSVGDDNGQGFTCKNFDAVKRQCTAYDVRPKMCRGHGTRYPCNHPLCEWAGCLHVDGRGERGKVAVSG
jgi:Fe-S-cluster containining protein